MLVESARNKSGQGTRKLPAIFRRRFTLTWDLNYRVKGEERRLWDKTREEVAIHVLASVFLLPSSELCKSLSLFLFYFILGFINSVDGIQIWVINLAMGPSLTGSPLPLCWKITEGKIKHGKIDCLLAYSFCLYTCLRRIILTMDVLKVVCFVSPKLISSLTFGTISWLLCLSMCWRDHYWNKFRSNDVIFL